jgi:hypothetical protein
MGNLHPVNCGKRQYTLRFWTVTTVLIIVLGGKTFRFKFTIDTSVVEIEQEIRKELNSVTRSSCGFVDSEDNTRVLLSVLKHPKKHNERQALSK